MKKLMVLVMVLGAVSGANGTVVDVVTDGLGDQGHGGTVGDPLAVGETIPIKLYLNSGFWLSSMDLTLVVSGPASLSVGGMVTKAGTVYELEGHPELLLVPDFTVDGNGNVTSNEIDRMQAISGFTGPVAGPGDLVWNMFVTCTGEGQVPIDLTIFGRSDYSAGAAGPPWAQMIESDLGDLTLYQPAASVYTLSTSVVGSVGGSISPSTGSQTADDVVVLTASADTGYRVKAWLGTDDDSSTGTTNAVTMTGPKSVSVEFELNPGPPATRYTLTTSIVGGTGAGGSIIPVPGDTDYDDGDEVPLTATPFEGWRVKAWTGTDNDASTENTNTVTMSSDQDVTVQFEQIPPPTTYTLTGSVIGGGGTLSPTNGIYEEDYVVPLTAAPFTGYQVKTWTGIDAGSADADPNMATVTMTADAIVTVEFELVAVTMTYELTSSVDGVGGTIDPCGTNTYDENEVVGLTATPASGYRVKAWSGIDAGSSAADPCRATVTMSGDKVVRVQFELAIVEEAMSVSSMTVKADKSRDSAKDSFDASGVLGMGATENAFLGAEAISVHLFAGSGEIWGSDELDPGDDFDKAGSKARYTFQQKIAKTDPEGGLSLARFDFTRSPATFSIVGDGIDLSGLKAPLRVEIWFGSYHAVGSDLDEDDVNGSKPIPLILLSGVEDVVKAATSPKVNSKGTSFGFSGEIVAVDPDTMLMNHDVTIVWGPGDATDKTWLIPMGAFMHKGTKCTAKRTLGDGTSVNVMVDLGKGSFKVSMKKTENVPMAGSFQMSWDGFDPRYDFGWE